jgi:hypothetical protein
VDLEKVQQKELEEVFNKSGFRKSSTKVDLEKVQQKWI